MAMADDWRLEIGLFEHGRAHALTERLAAGKLSDDLEEAFGERLVVSADPPDVFVYTGDRAQAEAAEAIRAVAAEHDWDIEIELRHWHPDRGGMGGPRHAAARHRRRALAEHAQLVAKEREDSAMRGYAEYEVKMQCSSHHDTVKLAKRLHEEGLPTVRRWKYLLVGARDEDAANAMAERLRAEAPPGATVIAEVSQRATYDDDPRAARSPSSAAWAAEPSLAGPWQPADAPVRGRGGGDVLGVGEPRPGQEHARREQRRQQDQEADLEPSGFARRHAAGMRADRRLRGHDARDQLRQPAEHQRRQRLGERAQERPDALGPAP